MSKSDAMLCPEMTDTKETKRTYLFVCTGNTCRSPMAAALYNHLFGKSGVRAVSAGLAADGSPISEKAKNALMERGVLPIPGSDYRSHASRCVTHEMLKEADLVIGLTSAHAMQLIIMYPTEASKITVMPRDIPDPYGGTDDDYKRCLSEIESALTDAFGITEDGNNE